MSEQRSTQAQTDDPCVKRRDDFLVSICISDRSSAKQCKDALSGLVAQLDQAFRFWEIVLVVEDGEVEAFEPVIRGVNNLRLFSVRAGTGHYERRVIAVEEAIGDIVVASAIDELSLLDVPQMVRAAFTGGQIAVGERQKLSVGERLLAPWLAMLGKASGFQATLRSMQTLAIPRTLLNQLLSSDHRELALRFPPVATAYATIVFDGNPHPAAHSRLSDTKRRIGLIGKLLICMAPKLLVQVAITSGLLVVLGGAYLLYTLAAWIVLSHIQPGWVTLSIMMSATAVFLGSSIFGLSLGLQYLISQNGKIPEDVVTREVNRVDLFRRVSDELNVELDITVLQSGDSASSRDKDDV